MAEGEPVPGISIEEALDRFLMLLHPGGLPAGHDREDLLRRLREVIARDRPAWAESYAPDREEPAAEPATYAERKARLVAAARREDVPDDPEERFFYERAKEAAAARELRRAEERDDRIREDLQRRLAAEHGEADPATIERVLRIRRQIEERLRQVVPQPERFDAGPLDLAAPAVEPVRLPGLAVEASTASDPEPAGLVAEDPVDAIRVFNEARRARLRPRAEHLSPRRPEQPSRRGETLSIEAEPAPPSGLTFDDRRPVRRTQPLRLE